MSKLWQSSKSSKLASRHGDRYIKRLSAWVRLFVVQSLLMIAADDIAVGRLHFCRCRLLFKHLARACLLTNNSITLLQRAKFFRLFATDKREFRGHGVTLCLMSKTPAYVMCMTSLVLDLGYPAISCKLFLLNCCNKLASVYFWLFDDHKQKFQPPVFPQCHQKITDWVSLLASWSDIKSRAYLQFLALCSIPWLHFYWLINKIFFPCRFE